MNCKDFQEIADSYLSDELLTETNHDMIRHMEACAGCRDLIGARREIRGRLKSAVIASSEYQLDSNFDHLLRTRIRHEMENVQDAGSGSWFGLRMVAMAAGLLIVAMISFALFTNLNTPKSSSYLVSGFAEESLVNIASGDHQHCAIEHNLEERPVALSEFSAKYASLENVVKDEFRTSFADHKLVESHACRYKDVRFAHFVVEGPEITLSVLVAPSDGGKGPVNERLSDFLTEDYRISSFDVDANTVFVISNLESEMNKKAASALADPFRKHFSAGKNVQTAMLGPLGAGSFSFSSF